MEAPPPPGVVELREDVPLKGVSGQADGAGGVRAVVGCFAALSIAVTLALIAQIYQGVSEVSLHGAASSGAGACSRAGAALLARGGSAADAAASTALCLALVSPHRSSLDASGSLLYWEYRGQHDAAPMEATWGLADEDAEAVTTNVTAGERPPRLVAAMAALHSSYGVLPWRDVLQSAINQATLGFAPSPSLLKAWELSGDRGDYEISGNLTVALSFASFLRSLQRNSSAELASGVKWREAKGVPLGKDGAGRAWAGGAGGAEALRVLSAALTAEAPLADSMRSIISLLLDEARADSGKVALGGAASGLAVVDAKDTYVALVSGLSVPLGSGPDSGQGYRRDEPTLPLDLAPAILVQGPTCGSRIVVGGESGAATAQVLGAGWRGAPLPAELPRVVTRDTSLPPGLLALEVERPLPPPAWLPPQQDAPPANSSSSTTSLLACAHLVVQLGDALTSHADSRAGPTGFAYRF